MLSTVYSAGISGIDGFVVTAECNVQNKLSQFDVVGLPDAAVREAKERIRNAIENNGYLFYDGAITINLAPADLKKEGSAYDLAMLVGIMNGMQLIRSDCDFSTKCFLGELSLSGDVRGIRGALSMALAAKDAGLKELYLPAANAGEAAAVEGIRVYGIGHIRELLSHLNGESVLSPAVFDRGEYERRRVQTDCDFADVKGQEQAKRALEIAAAGGHNVLLIGPPGTGKSMLAKRLPSILPELAFEEAIETSKIHSISGILNEASLLSARPFRSPHHTVSAVALAGGGKNPAPGEISLAHNGVLFLDELPEFNKAATEILRQPLEDGKITITRANGRYTFPCNFMLVCAMNPCRCGYYGHPVRSCTCRKEDIRKYVQKISGPLLDRIDIQIEMPSLSYEELAGEHPAESSRDIRKRVEQARGFSSRRIQSGREALRCNADMTSQDIRRYCILEDGAQELLKSAFVGLGLSARGYDRILRVARTVADLAGSEKIAAAHLAEAIQLRSLDRKYFNG